MADKKKTPREQQAEGTFDKVKGRVKEAAGALTNDNETRVKGQMDQVKGGAKEKTGELRENLREKI